MYPSQKNESVGQGGWFLMVFSEKKFYYSLILCLGEKSVTLSYF